MSPAGEVYRRPGKPTTEVDLGSYYRATPRPTVRKEAKAILRGAGVYVKASHVVRWDLAMAM